MGLNVGSIYSANSNQSIIDSQALSRVSEQILNPNKDQTIDVSKLDLSKFNRASLGTDLYASRTSTETALTAAKAASDFDVNLSQEFSSNVQYLNSQAAQSLFTEKDNNVKTVASIEVSQQMSEEQTILASSQISETQDMNNDKRGSNPFSFYYQTEQEDENENSTESIFNTLNIFA